MDDEIEHDDESNEEDEVEDEDGSKKESKITNNKNKWKVKSFEAEDVDDLSPTLDKAIDECRKCEEKMNEYEGLVCEYHRISQYALEQEAEVDELGNINHCIILLNYLEVNERKAQKNTINNLLVKHNSFKEETSSRFKKSTEKYNRFRDEAVENAQVIIDAHNEAVEKFNQVKQMHDDLADRYNELVELYIKEERTKKEEERKNSRYKLEGYKKEEERRNSRYKSKGYDRI